MTCRIASAPSTHPEYTGGGLEGAVERASCEMPRAAMADQAQKGISLCSAPVFNAPLAVSVVGVGVLGVVGVEREPDLPAMSSPLLLGVPSAVPPPVSPGVTQIVAGAVTQDVVAAVALEDANVCSAWPVARATALPASCR